MRYAPILLSMMLLAGCSDLTQGVQNAQQAVEAGKQAIEAGKEVVQQGKQFAESEVAQQLKAYLQQKYDSSEALRKAMFSGDGKLLTEELKKTELANFSFYRSELFGIEFRGKLTADGTFQVLRYSLTNPNEAPAVIKEFNVILDQNGQIQVQ
ncbi:hypothetical protein G3578_17160 [Brevibacillus sp. SYP-B805]|uniref:hypothetical protein n=1 Tax=Brevibacillus sp. SYP-B805 TaxID=1578199 RepID=UPI0013E9B238|nr:hypothetical protein [Brevibacillus sp. SYP-B805]NGQ96897.1 hypothetical protein [Brevibacillus sp. SYP-B805]